MSLRTAGWSSRASCRELATLDRTPETGRWHISVAWKSTRRLHDSSSGRPLTVDGSRHCQHLTRWLLVLPCRAVRRPKIGRGLAVTLPELCRHCGRERLNGLELDARRHSFRGSLSVFVPGQHATRLFLTKTSKRAAKASLLAAHVTARTPNNQRELATCPRQFPLKKRSRSDDGLRRSVRLRFDAELLLCAAAMPTCMGLRGDGLFALAA